MIKKMYSAIGKLMYWVFYFTKKFFDWLNLQDYKSKHVEVLFKDGVLKINYLEHEELVKKSEKEIKTYQKKNSPQKTIEKALRLAVSGCVFVVFQSEEDDDKFIQFWTSRGNLKHDFPMSKTNGLLPYRLTIIGLLANMEFVKKSFIVEKSGFLPTRDHYFWVNKDQDLVKINAKFHKDYELAAKYTYLALKKVLKVNPKKIKIIFG